MLHTLCFQHISFYLSYGNKKAIEKYKNRDRGRKKREGEKQRKGEGGEGGEGERA